MTATTWWLVAALVLGIVELLTFDFIFLMMALASLASALAAFLGAPLWGQVIVFALSSLVLLFLVRPWAKSFLARNTPPVETNAQGLVGLEAVVRTPVTESGGRVFLAGSEWSARTEGGYELPPETKVTVTRIEGATAIVQAK